MMKSCVHFVGFIGEEYWSAVKVWGLPHFIHMGWDLRARREIGEKDVIVFANGVEKKPVDKNYHDTKECARLGWLSEQVSLGS